MKCRHCGTPLSHVFIDLGRQPLSNSFLTADQLKQPEPVFPLKVFVCPKCFLVQVDEHKNAEEIFNRGYVYYSSYSSSWLEHARRYVAMAAERFRLDAGSLVVEVASNDGYLLQYFQERRIPCYGVEPSLATAEVARAKGIDSVPDFFGERLAEALARERGEVDLLVGNNVLAHVPDINDFVKGVGRILKPAGVATLEFPHLMNLVERCQFDTIYHEHFSYLSFGTVQRIFAQAGLRLFDVESLPTHGGSLRIYACRDECDAYATSDAVGALLERERAAGMTTLAYYTNFQAVVDRRCRELVSFLERAHAEGRSVAAYGAAAKGNTLLNYCGVHTDLIAFCVDASPHKQRLFMPGSHVPVLAPAALRERRPDYVLILPWNIKNEVMARHGYITEWGGRFVLSDPALTIVDGPKAD